VPGIAECPVNLECRVALLRELYGRAVAVFLEVVGASISEDLLERDRTGLIAQYPTYEVDDVTNAWGGSIERLGVNGELLETPAFPACAKRGPDTDMTEWIADLHAERLLTDAEHARLDVWLGGLPEASGEHRAKLRARITRALTLAAWEQWDDLHAQIGLAD